MEGYDRLWIWYIERGSNLDIFQPMEGIKEKVEMKLWRVLIAHGYVILNKTFDMFEQIGGEASVTKRKRWVISRKYSFTQ